MFASTAAFLLFSMFIYIGVSGQANEELRNNFAGIDPTPLLFDPTKEKCCRGTVHPFGLNFLELCCGMKTFDPTREVCCDGEVNPIKLGYACCGTTVYYTDEEICCWDTPVKLIEGKSESRQCCGITLYNDNDQICCNDDVVVDKKSPSSNKCCGIESYDPNLELCCSTYDYESGTRLYTSVVAKMNGQTRCCGNKTYDFTTHSCCDMISKVYDTTNEICCWDRILERKNDQIFCCGKGNVYDNTKELCCGEGSNAKVVKRNASENTCCGEVPYDTEKAACCIKDGQRTVTPYTDYNDGSLYSVSVCCNDGAYKSDSGICCTSENGRELFHRNIYYKTHSCCGIMAYDQQKEFCCGGRVYGLNQNIRCCGTEIYNRNSQVCCLHVIYEKLENTNCCGDNLYDADRQLCCEVFLSDTSYSVAVDKVDQNTSCCGSFAYNRETEICCGFSKLQKEGNRNTCCFGYTTDDFIYLSDIYGGLDE